MIERNERNKSEQFVTCSHPYERNERNTTLGSVTFVRRVAPLTGLDWMAGVVGRLRPSRTRLAGSTLRGVNYAISDSPSGGKYTRKREVAVPQGEVTLSRCAVIQRMTANNVLRQLLSLERLRPVHRREQFGNYPS